MCMPPGIPVESFCYTMNHLSPLEGAETAPSSGEFYKRAVVQD